MRKKYLRAQNERLRQQLRQVRANNAALAEYNGELIGALQREFDTNDPPGPARWPSPAHDPKRTRPVA